MWPRSEFDPGHFTASGFVLSPDRESLLLILHGKLDRWLQPGGHFEVDDASVEAAARRELAEETGLSSIDRVGAMLVRIDAHDIPERGHEPGHLHIDLGVGFIAQTLSLGPLDEVVDARWVSFGDLPSYGVDHAVSEGAEQVRRMFGTTR
jgi:8-oxo-dGTP pyrophosphatase MutT (NUDIX family)